MSLERLVGIRRCLVLGHHVRRLDVARWNLGWHLLGITVWGVEGLGWVAGHGRSLGHLSVRISRETAVVFTWIDSTFQRCIKFAADVFIICFYFDARSTA